MSTPDTKTDDSKLVTTDTVYVRPDGSDKDESNPAPNVEYYFCVDVANASELPSGSFFVRFTLSGDQDPPLDLDFKQEAGLDAGRSVKAVVHFGTFPPIRLVSSGRLYLFQFCTGEPYQLRRLI